MSITVSFKRLFFAISLLVAVVVVFQCFTLNYNGTYLSFSSPTADKGSAFVVVFGNATSIFNSSKLAESGEKLFHSDLTGEIGDNSEFEEKGNVLGYESEEKVGRLVNDSSYEAQVDRTSSRDVVMFKKGVTLLSTDESSGMANSTERGQGERARVLEVESGYTLTDNDKEDKTKAKFYADSRISDSVQHASSIISNNSNAAIKSISMLKRGKVRSTSISEMNSILLQNRPSSLSGVWIYDSKKQQRSSARDRELLLARRKIENAPIMRNTPGLYAPIFRNVSVFTRSYELMERTLKVYVYKEGERPIFHQPYMRGIYSSEGWFMKLMEGNKNFVVKDQKKAHLFYLPFSANLLRSTLYERKIQSHKALEKVLKDYVELIAGKYRYWNRTGGRDHFLVACHDWASRLTRNYMGNCIRSLCNSNLARGFTIGKDTTLPVTYIKSVQRPLGDLGGKPPSERSILAFFAGSMHGYLRPILLQYWENKEPDMKIFGPMPRDLNGKKVYREYMKSSKYCICARGYEVHTPRVVESILYECVPVILSDNYVPPFFEVLNWESFSVFVKEEDIPNLGNILRAIPEEKYFEMQLNVKMVQQHFLWHKPALKYDLFHMTLHSVWYNRVFQVKVKPR
ncbi:hypothetical protein ACFE04_018638 [Oxalis oulophora]